MPNPGTESQFEETTIDRLPPALRDTLLPELLSGELRMKQAGTLTEATL